MRTPTSNFLSCAYRSAFRRQASNFSKLLAHCAIALWEPSSASAMGRLRIILGRLPAIEHAVVTHDTDVPHPTARRELGRSRESGCVSLRLPYHHQNGVARRKNGIKDFPRH